MNKSIAISSKDYSAGDVIVKCCPLVYTVKYEYRGMCCDFCLKFNSQLRKCSKCRKLYYCNIECQKKDWSYHKYECPVLSRYGLLGFEKQGFDYMQRMTLRLYLMSVAKPDVLKRKYQLHNGLFRSIDDMESHSLDIKSSKSFEGIVNYFKLYSINDYDMDLVLKLYGILQINSFGIDVYNQDRGISHCASGLYIEGSVFDHCCQSNACASGDGLVLEIRALKDIKIGEEVTIDYVQNVLPKDQRQSSLNEKYYFICQCFRCQSTFDQNFDYELFGKLDNKNSLDGQKSFKDYKTRHELIRKFYPHFHPNYTYFLYEYLKWIFSFNSNRSSKLCKNLIKELKENMRITHGLDHTFNQMFLNLIQQR